MATSRTNLMKRKRNDNSNDMPTIRERIDEETGRIITVQIETTREAKKRRQKNGGARWIPTTGEINAADIYNKQEEKIKRDKERVERKKKQAVRQAEKDVRAKEVQEEMLRKGKISIEDTWGKVSASQNRLNRFFVAPKANKELAQPAISDRLDDEKSEPQETTIAVGQSHEDNDMTGADLATFITGSQLTQQTPARLSKISSRSSNGANTANTLMPPPPMPQQRQRPGKVHCTTTEAELQHKSSTLIESPPARLLQAPRRPLSLMSPSQINVRDNQQPTPRSCSTKKFSSKPAEAIPLSTQVVLDTLEGISSQDLEDDLDDDPACDKENSPSKPIPVSFAEDVTTIGDCRNDCLGPDPDHSETDMSSDEFDDDGIDDETLMFFAATQRVRSNFCQSPKKNHKPSSPISIKALPRDTKALPDSSIVEAPVVVSKKPAAGDSFAFTDVDDEDLLRCVEDFENDTDDLEDQDLLDFMEDFEAGKKVDEQDRPKKSRRILPWIKNPISFSSQDVVEATQAGTQSFHEW